MNPRYHRALARTGMLAFATVLIGGLSGIPALADGELPAPDEVAAQLREDRVAVAPNAPTSVDEDDVLPLVEETDPPVFFLIANSVPNDFQAPRDHLDAVRNATGVPGTYVGLYGDRVYAASDDIDSGRLAAVTTDANGGDIFDNTYGRVADVIVRADELNGGSAVSPPSGPWGGGLPDNPYLWVIVVGAAVIAVGYFLLPSRHLGGGGPPSVPGAGPARRRRWDQVPAQETWEESEQLDDAWVRAEEAITRLGEELSALPVDLSDDRLEIAVRRHVEDALLCYERAKRGLEMEATRQTQLATATTWIEDGDYHLASVKAILSGAPEPEPPEGHRLHRP